MSTLTVAGKDLIIYIPILTTIGLSIYIVWQSLQPRKGLINFKIKKNGTKVVDSMDIEDIGDNIAFCRCWISQKVTSVLSIII